MKKILSVTIIFLILFVSIFSMKIYAASLDAIDVTTNRQIVHPGETVTLNVAFGTDLGSYTIDVAYDNNLLEYVSNEGGTANDTGTKVRVAFYDQTGGSAPRSQMSITFKAKTDITTSNPTDLSVTAEGLANPDASVQYDDITIPIVKNIVVEPAYVDYDIALKYTGDVIENEEKNMKLVVSSSMGKNYEHTRILAEVTGPTDGTAKLVATDSQNLEHDIVQSGWGDASGDAIGGKDVVKELDVRGLFNKAGKYAITLKLIDRDNSDAEIARKTVEVTVKEKTANIPSNEEETTNIVKTEEAEKPETLPKTGNMIYFAMIPTVILLVVAYAVLRKKD